MSNKLGNDLDLCDLAVTLSQTLSEPEELALALRSKLQSAVPDVDDEICSAALNWVAQAVTMHASAGSLGSEAEMRDAVSVASAFCGFRCGQTA